MAKATDVEVIVDEGNKVVLESGTEVILVPLKSRQFFKMLRIITHGAGGMLLNFKFSANDTPEEFGAKLVALLAFAIPDAEDEVFDFLQSMVEPAALKKGKDLTKSQLAENVRIKNELLDELENPELGDTLTLVEAIVKREAEDLQALGKRLMQMFDLAKKTGQIPAEMTE
jgi:hypothetical protein